MDNKSALISYCGLYCGSCSSLIKGSCPGCARKESASWCKVCKCNIVKVIRSCADCKEYQNISDCTRFNNFAAKVFGIGSFIR